MTFSKPATLFAALFLLAGLAACDGADSDDGPAEPNYETVVAADVIADPASGRGADGRALDSGRYTLFDLREGSIVLASSDDGDRSDSLSTAWDIGLQGLNVVTNGGASGPGQAAGYIAERAFGEVTEVDTDRLETDTETSVRLRDWYSYNSGGQNYVRPTPGRTLVVRTASGDRYAKIRILSYYRGNPELPIEGLRNSRYYTFEYLLSDDTRFE